MRTYAERRTNRRTKALRRLRDDRATHSGSDGPGGRFECACFAPDGRTFARFADYPRACSCFLCCNGEHGPWRQPTRQEIRADADVRDWQEVL